MTGSDSVHAILDAQIDKLRDGINLSEVEIKNLCEKVCNVLPTSWEFISGFFLMEMTMGRFRSIHSLWMHLLT